MYTYEGMRVYSLSEALFLKELLKTMPGYFWCYPDNTEEMIMVYPSAKEIKNKYKNGVVLGKGTPERSPLEEDMTMEELSVILNMSPPLFWYKR